MMAKIVEQTRGFIKEHKLDKEEWVLQILGGMATELYATESLAYELIGRADHHGTKIRPHRIGHRQILRERGVASRIRSAEKIMGIEGCTQMHEVEKTPPRCARPQHLRRHQRSAAISHPARPH